VVAGGKEYKFTGTCVFSADFTTNTDTREISVDGQTWTLLAESKATRVK
jgi:hypothetical protein